jgi:hypothetical protein
MYPRHGTSKVGTPTNARFLGGAELRHAPPGPRRSHHRPPLPTRSKHRLRFLQRADKARAQKWLLKGRGVVALERPRDCAACSVSDVFVGKMREQFASVNANVCIEERTYTTRHGTKAKRKVKRRQAKQTPELPPQVAADNENAWISTTLWDIERGFSTLPSARGGGRPLPEPSPSYVHSRAVARDRRMVFGLRSGVGGQAPEKTARSRGGASSIQIWSARSGSSSIRTYSRASAGHGANSTSWSALVPPGRL